MFKTFFSVRENIPIQTSLEEASAFLSSASELAYSEEVGAYAVGNLIELAKALVDDATSKKIRADRAASSSVDAEPTGDNAVDATNRYDLTCSLSCDISFVNNILIMVEDRVGKGKDGTLFSLLEAVMPRMKQALERVEKLEVMV